MGPLYQMMVGLEPGCEKLLRMGFIFDQSQRPVAAASLLKGCVIVLPSPIREFLSRLNDEKLVEVQQIYSSCRLRDTIR